MTSKNRLSALVVVYLVARAAVWTLLLFFTQPALPLDVLEHLAWGREWRIVYAHHPGLPAWINEAINLTTGGSALALSVAAPICVSAAMACVWLLARRVVDERRAVVAMLATEGVYYFNVAATEFNHNVLSLCVCAWLFYLTHRAFFNARDVGGRAAESAAAGIATWLLLGLAAALSLYAKYSAVLFLFAVFAWSIGDPLARRRWRTFGPWLALALFALLTAPQFVALADLRFAPLRFAVDRAGAAAGWADHFAYPLRFAITQLGAMAAALFLCALAIGKAHRFSPPPPPAEKANRRFVVVVAFAPLALALLASFVGGWRFKSMWGATMLSFIPLWLLMLFPSRQLRWRRFCIGAALVSALALLIAAGINVGAPYWSGRGKRVHYPAPEIGEYVEAQWSAMFDSPLRFVAGKKHMASLASFYAPSRPSAIIGGDWEKNFWVSPEEFAKCGGAIVWAIDDGKKSDKPPPAFADAYPSARRAPTMVARWRSAADIPPLKIGLLLVPPRAKC